VIYIGVGSNVQPRRNILRGVSLLGARLHLTAASTFYRNPAVHPHHPPQNLPPFINGVVRGRTSLPPASLPMHLLRPLEAACGRARTGDPNAPRPLDLDLLAVEGLSVCTETLRLPDPDILRYPFLAVPLAELAPHLVPVGADRPVGEIARGMPAETLREEVSLTRTIQEWIAGMAGSWDDTTGHRGSGAGDPGAPE